MEESSVLQPSKPRPTTTAGLVKINVTITAAQDAELSACAERAGVPRSAVMRQVIDAGLRVHRASEAARDGAIAQAAGGR